MTNLKKPAVQSLRELSVNMTVTNSLYIRTIIVQPIMYLQSVKLINVLICCTYNI